MDQRRFAFRVGWRKRPKTLRCERCNAKFNVPERGRLPEYCGQTCRQRAYEKRKWARHALVEAFARDLTTIRFRDLVRREIRQLLQGAGVPLPPDPPPQPRSGPKLSVIPGDRKSEIGADPETGVIDTTLVGGDREISLNEVQILRAAHGPARA